MRAAFATMILAVALTSCDDGPTLLIVDLRTDLVPGVELDAVRTEVLSGDAAGRRVDHAVDAEADYLDGVRVAELTDLEPGELTVEVVLLRDGAAVVSRPVRVTLERTMAVTVVVTRDCRGVECPAPDGDPVAEACVGGTCADPRCTEEQPDACVGECAGDADCPAPAAACASARCVGGACLAVPDDASCGADEYCEAETGCQPREQGLCPAFSGASLDLHVFGNYACVQSSDQPLRCWGDNDTQLGAPHQEPVGTPREVEPTTRWTVVALGRDHFCGVDQSGSDLVQCVGTDWAGQLGDGEGSSGSADLGPTSPTIAGVAVTAGDFFTCALGADEAVSCWGSNSHGQVGADLTDEFVWTPARVVSTETWAAVDASGPHACAITTGGALYCWGSNANFELAQDPATLDLSRVPYAMGSDTDWVEVAVGREFVLARKSDGSVWSWGGDFDGQLGRDGPSPAILRVGADDDWEKLAAGFRHACGIRSGGALWCWGSNDRGQLTDAVTLDEVDLPTRVAPDRVWVDVGLGFRHTCALDDTGRVWCWGANHRLQLGDGVGPDRGTPAPVCP